MIECCCSARHLHDEKIAVSSNNSEIVRLWALAGKGIIYKSQLDMAEDIRANSLVKILDEYQPRAVDLNMICPSRAQITPAVLLLRDILKMKFSQLLLENK